MAVAAAAHVAFSATGGAASAEAMLPAGTAMELISLGNFTVGFPSLFLLGCAIGCARLHLILSGAVASVAHGVTMIGFPTLLVLGCLPPDSLVTSSSE